MSNFVSIVIPCRNEEKYIYACLDSILTQDYPKDSMEILVADGMSTDKTRDVLQVYAAKHPFIHWFENPKKIVPTGLNILIKKAKGDVILRMDAHSYYPNDYVTQCVKHLMEHNVDNVGGAWVTLPGAQTFTAQAIALALTSNFGVGNSLFRTAQLKEPQLVDTVPFGCYKRDVFDRIGLFDEDLVRNQDDEFNSRLIKSGGKILLVPSIVLKYYARTSFLKLWRMYYQYGYFKPLAAIKLGGVMTWRQTIPSIFIVSLAVGFVASFHHPAFPSLLSIECATYLLVSAFASFNLSFRHGIYLLPYIMFAFLVIHFSYGIGYLKGMFDFLICKVHINNKINDMALSR